MNVLAVVVEEGTGNGVQKWHNIMAWFSAALSWLSVGRRVADHEALRFDLRRYTLAMKQVDPLSSFRVLFCCHSRSSLRRVVVLTRRGPSFCDPNLG